MTKKYAKISNEYIDFLKDITGIRKDDDRSSYLARCDLRQEKNARRCARDVSEFWGKKLRVILESIQAEKKMKSYFWGTTFPHTREKFLCRTALYSEKIILPDSVYRTLGKLTGPRCLGRRQKRVGKKFASRVVEDVSFLVKIQSWIEEEIAIVLPLPEYWSTKTETAILRLARKDARSIKKEKYFRDIGPGDPLKDFIQGDAAKKYSADRLVSQLPYFVSTEEIQRISMRQLTLMNAIDMNSLLFARDCLGVTPSFDAEVKWELLFWKLEHDKQTLAALGYETQILRALENINLPFLDNVPLKYILELRKEGKLEGVRQMFNEKFSEIGKIRRTVDFKEAVRQLGESIQSELNTHENELENLKSDVRRKVLIDTAGIVAGAIVGLATQSAMFPIIVEAIFGGRILKDIQGYFSKKKEVQLNSMHILWKIKEQAK